MYARLAMEMEGAVSTGDALPPREELFAVVMVERPEGWEPENKWSVMETPPWTKGVAIVQINLRGRDAFAGSLDCRFHADDLDLRIRDAQAIAEPLPPTQAGAGPAFLTQR
jgi:hypothetical protein